MHFLASLIPAALALLGLLMVTAFVAARLQGAAGVVLAIVAGGSFVLGLLLAYWILVDWLNLRIIRRTLAAGRGAFRDGAVVAVSGVVRVDGPPLTSPFTGIPCAAYTYVVSFSQSRSRGGTERAVLAQGFHFVRTRIDGDGGSVRLRSFPSFEDDLRESAPATRWRAELRALMDAIGGARPATDRERASQLIDARRVVIDEVARDYRMGPLPDGIDAYTIEEEVLPLGQDVCAIGTYHHNDRSLTARRSRLGPNLMIYQGPPQEVLARVGADAAGFLKGAAWLLGIAVVIVSFAAAPASLTARLPLLGALVDDTSTR